MSKSRARLLWASSSLAAIGLALAPGAALAQAGEIDALVVTASRVTGFTAPTPTTIVGVEDLQNTAAPTMADVLNRLPSFSGSGPTAQSVGTANPGANYINLRNLGDNRTLVLLDGRRHVPTSDKGTVDINVLPSALVRRVDVVTGGASAAYGSDAVSGVVNFILDKDFAGVKGLAQTGITARGDDRTHRLSLAWGGKLLDDRGHLMLAAEYTRTSDTPYYGDRAWGSRNYQQLANAAGATPLRLVVPNVRYSNMTYGGLINSGPLKGTQFLPNGATQPFQYGTLVGANFMLGGGGDTLLNDVVLDVPSTRSNVFGRFDYQLTPGVNAALEVSHAQSETMSTTTAPFDASIVIQRDNAYLPASVRNAMTAANLATVTVGRLNRDMGLIHNGGDTQTHRVVAALDGTIGAGWKWDAYLQWGQTDYLQTQPNDRNNVLWLQGVDAVVAPAGNVNAGRVVCRSTVAAPANGCLPLNIFGDGSMDFAAMARVMGTAWFRSLITEWSGGANVSGEPFSIWAGPVAVAAGAEFRKEELKTTSDATSLAKAWRIGNFQPLSGEYDVKEYYAEVGVPLIKNQPLFKDLSLNLAGRYTDYSLSGGVKTWKAGAVWALNDRIQLRATQSRDIRAPNLGELYQAGNQLSGGIIDRINGNQQYTAASFTGGNPNLKPERATTKAFGVVISPSFTPGLRLSADYYDINIVGAIASINGQVTIDRCFMGAAEICKNITRSPTTGLITRIDSTFLNVASRHQRGYDFEGSYALPVREWFDGFQGDLSLRVLATRLVLNDTNDGSVTLHTAGQAAVAGQPKWKVNAKLDYSNGPLTLFVEQRYLSSTVYDNAFTERDIADNSIPATYYTTVSASYDLVSVEGEGRATVFGVIDNLFDRDPAIVAGTGFTSQTQAQIFDVLGRRYTVGLRFVS